MPLKKSVSIAVSVIILVTAAVSSYFIIDMFVGTSFKMESWSVVDDKGFPAISYDYSCSNYVAVKMFDSNSNLVGEDFFLAGRGSKNISLGAYKQTIKGDRIFKAYTKEGDEILSKSFSFSGPILSVNSCDQKWWINGDKTILLGLSFNVYNSGDTPVYPYSIDVITTTKTFSGLVLPKCVNPGENVSIDCVVYKKDAPESSIFSVNIKDIDGNIISSGSFSFDVQNDVSTKYFDKGVPKRLGVPYPEFLFNYYSNLDRLTENDYSYYIFDPYDDYYLDIFLDCLISTLPFGETSYNSKTDSQKIDFITEFVQYLEYKEDIVMGNTSEYANYPLETIFNRNIGCDCEDKAILTASLLDRAGYDVALFRLPDHMAVGVKLSDAAIPKYDHYVDGYYYLETTTEEAPIGFVPSQYKSSLSDLTIYEISDRPYLMHQWVDNVLTVYTKTKFGNFVKIDTIVGNYGRSTAFDITVEGVFVTSYGIELNSDSTTISSLEPGKKKKVTFSVDIPSVASTFESRIIYGGKTVDIKESSSTFP